MEITTSRSYTKRTIPKIIFNIFNYILFCSLYIDTCLVYFGCITLNDMLLLPESGDLQKKCNSVERAAKSHTKKSRETLLSKFPDSWSHPDK